MTRFLASLRQLAAALRMLLIFTVILGVLYPLAVTAVAQIPGLKSRADGSLIKGNGKVVGSKLIGQSFTDSDGNPLPQYFQSRPSAAGAGYDPTASAPSNLGPESIVDTLPDPSREGRHRHAAPAHARSAPAASRSASSTASTGHGRSARRTASARCWPCSTPGRATTAPSPGSSASTRPARPSRSSRPTRVCRWSARSSARTTPRARSCRSAATRRRTRRCRPMRSPPPGPAWTPRSARPTRSCRSRASPRRAASPSPRSRRWSASSGRAATSASWASQRSTSCN